MKRLFQPNIISILLSVLILASTASIRSAKAEGESSNLSYFVSTPAAGDEEETQIAEILSNACASEPNTGADTASLAAERIRFDEGLISHLSSDGKQSRNQRLIAAFAAARRVLEHSLDVDWSGWNKTLVDFRSDVYDCYAQNQSAFASLAVSMNIDLQRACATCGKVLSRDLRAADIPLTATGRQETQLSWRQCAALYYVFGEDLSNVLADTLCVQQEGSMIRGVTIRWPNPAFDQIAADGTKEQLVEAKLALYYLNTVYLEDGTVAPVSTVTFSKEYLATVSHPVPGGIIKNGWYDPRSHRTRLHIGTDIRISAKTPILAVTDGVVLHVGYLPIPGNYVVVRDPYGYEYHYYHMYELSTFVKEGDTVRQGQQIGRVGSTGNSVAYHLHLGLVSPDGVYLNPYDLFTQAGIGPVQTN